jgi:hypothetical protein
MCKNKRIKKKIEDPNNNFMSFFGFGLGLRARPSQPRGDTIPPSASIAVLHQD